MPLRESQIKALREYTYKGKDTSYIYEYALSPLAQFCVDLTPTWVAPNTITLVGLCFPLLSMILHLVYNPTLTADGPRWLFLLNSVNLFIYQTLDNMDGKQARKTGSSSPLGLLFDHGCDSVNAGINIINVAAVLGLGGTTGIFYGMYVTMIPFYIATWEEYFLDEMILPVINGPTEGILAFVAIGFVSFLYGPGFWHTPIPANIPFPFKEAGAPVTPMDFLYVLGFLAAVLTSVSQIAKVIMHCIKHKKPLHTVLISLVPFIVLSAGVGYWGLNSDVFVNNPAWTALFVSSVFVELVVHVMFMHLCDSPLNIFRWPLLSLLAVVGNMWYPVVLELQLVIACGIINSVLLAIQTYRMGREVADVLNIYVFRIGKKTRD